MGIARRENRKLAEVVSVSSELVFEVSSELVIEVSSEVVVEVSDIKSAV